MAKIRFAKDLPEITVAKGAPLMQSLLDAQLPVASSCYGKGVCGKCRVQVLQGSEHLSPESPAEKFLREKNKIPDGFRISCQTLVFGDVKIDTTYW